MKYRSILSGLCLLGLMCATVQAADHRVEPLKEAAPKAELSESIAAQLAPTELREIRGTTRSVCDI